METTYNWRHMIDIYLEFRSYIETVFFAFSGKPNTFTIENEHLLVWNERDRKVFTC